MGLNIEINELKKISSDSKTLKGQLSGNLTEMKNLLEQICTNVNSSELTGVNKNLVQAIENISNDVEKNLPNIIAFMDRQIASYEKTNAETKSALDALANSADATLNQN